MLIGYTQRTIFRLRCFLQANLGMLTENLLFRKHTLVFSSRLSKIHFQGPNLQVILYLLSLEPRHNKPYFWYNRAPAPEDTRLPASWSGEASKR
jgi:hypothetical protein